MLNTDMLKNVNGVKGPKAIYSICFGIVVFWMTFGNI